MLRFLEPMPASVLPRRAARARAVRARRRSPGERGLNTHDGRDVGGKASFEVAAGARVRIADRAVATTAGPTSFGSPASRCARLRRLRPLLGTARLGPVRHWTDGPSVFIVHPTYRLRGGRAVVQLFGRLSSGVAFLVEDTRFRPYFFTHPDATRLLADGARR